MNTAIAFVVGVVLGVPLGWTLLFLLAMSVGEPKEPPTKDEWRMM